MNRRSLGRALCLGVAVATLLCGCDGVQSAGTGGSATNGTGQLSLGLTAYPVGQRLALPDVSGPTLDGGTLDLASLRGHIVVLNVWASWCTECRTESPALAHLAALPALTQVRFVGVDEQDKSSAARSFAQAVGTTYPHVIDQSGSLLGQLPMVPATAIPSTLVVDPQGRIAARVIGAVDGATLLHELKALLRES